MGKSYYIVKKKTGKRWTAFEFTATQVSRLKPGLEHKGPFKSLVACMIAANK